MLDVTCRRLPAFTVTAMFLAVLPSGSGFGAKRSSGSGACGTSPPPSRSQDGAYRIAVEMLPVKAFDPATNKALNLSKGRMYAAQALGKHLKASSLTIRGLEIRESGTGGKSFRLVAVVPRDGVSAGAGTPIPENGTRRRTPPVVHRQPRERPAERHPRTRSA